jgi:hypothetical protein
VEASIVKAYADGSEHYCLGVVLEPLADLPPVDGRVRADLQGDTYTAEEIRKACHYWMEQQQHALKLQHQSPAGDKVIVLENWLAPDDCVIGEREIAKGTWLLAVRVVDDQLWSDVRNGKITGFSVGGLALRAPYKRAA